MYHVFSYADVMRVLVNRDAAFSRDPSPWLPAGPHHMALDFMWTTEPFTFEGEEGRHDELRRVVEPWFKKRAIRDMEPVVRGLAVQLIDEIVQKGTGEFNLARELAYRLSMRVICRLTGIELAREQWLREKLDEFSQATSYSELPLQWDAEAYFWQMVAKRLTQPQDELLDVLIGAWKDARINDAELLGYIYGFVAAGTDTTGTSFVNLFTVLAEIRAFGLWLQRPRRRGRVEENGGGSPPVRDTVPDKAPFRLEGFAVREPDRSGGKCGFDLVRGREPRRGGERRHRAERPEPVRPSPVAKPSRRARLGETPLPRRRPRSARVENPAPRGAP